MEQPATVRVSGSIPCVHTGEVWKVSGGSMRERMPKVAAFVDDLRAAFGTDYINGAIRQGMQGRRVFWASENGHELGTKWRAIEADENDEATRNR